MKQFLKNLFKAFLEEKQNQARRNKQKNYKQKRKYQSQNAKKKQTRNMVDVDQFREIETVKLVRLIDGDTAWFKFANNQEYKVRFLFIDTPESTKIVEKYGKEATEFVRKQLRQASKIEIEFDQKRYDHYDRVLGWIWVTHGNKRELLQAIIAKNGFVEKFFDYGTYKYEDLVRRSLNDKYNIFEQENYDRHKRKKY